MRFRFPHFAVMVAAMVFAVSSQSAEFSEVNVAASQISFTFSQFGSRVYGTFGKFEGTLDFDTQNPNAAHSTLHIDLTSIDAGSGDANSELQKPAWFDTAAHPLAIFQSTSIRALGDDRYLFSGNLTLKAVTRPIEVQVQLSAESGIGIFVGEFALNRDDFKIGAGEWADSVVSKNIDIRFRIVAPQR